MDLRITIEIWHKGEWFIAKCPELDFISQGKTRETAKKNLIEVIQIQFEEMEENSTLDEYLSECGYVKQNNTIIPNVEMIGFEKLSVQVTQVLKITPLHWKVLIKVFEDYGCQYKRKKGSHHILTYPDAKRAIVIPEYDEIDVEIIKNNMQTVGMTRDELFKLLKG